MSNERQTFISSCEFHHFILFVYETTGNIGVQFLKERSDPVAALENLVILIRWQCSIQVGILYTDCHNFDEYLAGNYLEVTDIIEEFLPLIFSNKTN